VNAEPLIESSRGSLECRACGSIGLLQALDLGLSPVANSLPPLASDKSENFYPLRLMICRDCFLGQIAEYETPDQIFSSYPYLSSTSSYWVDHCLNYANTALSRFPNITSGYVLEIASNDGYLLQHFKDKGVKVLGIEPAKNVADLANTKGIFTVSDFFSESLARKIKDTYGYPTLIVANNVAAHVPDMVDFFSGISILCSQRTLVSIENPSLGYLFERGYYDTIYHEHFSYISVNPIQKLVESLGMVLFEVETLPTHGGSLRYWISSHKSIEVDESVVRTAREESLRGVGNIGAITEFSENVRREMSTLNAWVNAQPPRSIIAYGAAAKTVTTFFAADLNESKFSMIVDANPLKQGNRLPGTSLPILGLDQISDVSTSKLVIFPWNLEDEIVKNVRSINAEIEIWVLNPLRRVN
jgi:hypothetical protein